MLSEAWHTPNASNGGGSCVEARYADGVVTVRNSNDPAGPSVDFTRTEWATFISSADEFTLPE